MGSAENKGYRPSSPPMRRKTSWISAFTEKDIALLGGGAAASISVTFRRQEDFKKFKEKRAINAAEIVKLDKGCKDFKKEMNKEWNVDNKDLVAIEREAIRLRKEGKSADQIKEGVISSVKKDNTELANALNNGMLKEIMEHLEMHHAASERNAAMWEEHKQETEGLNGPIPMALRDGGIVGVTLFVLLIIVNSIRGKMLLKRIEKEGEEKAERKERERRESEGLREEKRRRKEEKKRQAQMEREEAAKRASCTPIPPIVEDRTPKKRARITKNELKGRVSDILEADFGEDADKASKIVFRKIGREACKKIIDNPDDVYEIVGESTGFSGSDKGAEWILERLSEMDHDAESGRRVVQSSACMTHEDLEFTKDVEGAIRGKGLDVENVKRVLVNGFNLNAPKRAIGRVYHRGDLLKKRIDQDLQYNNMDPGKVREDVLDFLKSHGAVSTYKRGTCMMINTVPELGQSRPISETGKSILDSVVKWIVDYKKMQNPGRENEDS